MVLGHVHLVKGDDEIMLVLLNIHLGIGKGIKCNVGIGPCTSR